MKARFRVAGSLAVIAASLAVSALGVWITSQGAALGIGLLVLGVLAFVLAFASSMPQSTGHVRED